jgi:hypothetical protein
MRIALIAESFRQLVEFMARTDLLRTAKALENLDESKYNQKMADRVINYIPVQWGIHFVVVVSLGIDLFVKARWSLCARLRFL